MDSILASEDLVQTQRDRDITYRALAAPAGPSANTLLRRRLLRLSTRMMRLRQQAGSSGRFGTRAA
jgi:hypothetical protein